METFNVKQQRFYQNQSGRSMGEMLTVLAIIGVLSVVALAGYNHAMNKEKANKIIHDGRIVHTLSLSHDDETENWATLSDFISESNKTFTYFIDTEKHHYVKVDNIEEEICKQLMTLSGDNLHFYKADGTTLTTCEDNVSLIIDYNNNGPMAECITYSDCTGENVYCSGGQCIQCGNGQTVNDDRTGCNCSDEELTCSDANENTWCCGKDSENKPTICGTTKGTCERSDGYCAYTMTAPTQTSTLASNCSYTMGQITQQSTLASNCTYTMSQDGTSVSLTTTLTNGGCPDGYYCYLKYSEDDCSVSITTSGYTGPIHGVCVAQNSNSSQCLETSSTTTGGLSKDTGCPDGYYCYLKYSDTTCLTSITTSGYTGPINGVCVAQSSNSSQCLETSSTTTGGLSADIPCPANQYCYLKYRIDEDCSSSITTSGYTGSIYGVCTAQNSNNAVCPVPQDS